LKKENTKNVFLQLKGRLKLTSYLPTGEDVMPSQRDKLYGFCPCFLCGKVVQMRTVRDHANNARLDQFIIDETGVFPIDIQNGREMEGQQIANDGNVLPLRRITRDTLNLLKAYDLYFANEDNLGQHLWENDDNAPTLGLLITMHLDWIATFRVSDVSAGHVWASIRSLLHGHDRNNPLGVTPYSRILRFVDKHKLETVEKIPVCPCGDVIYYDFDNEDLRDIYKFCSASDRDYCVLCTLSKCVPGTTVPRKIVYYISPEVWMRDLYQRSDIAEHLHNNIDIETCAEGSLRRSQGWKNKVTDNPKMNSDRRHAPVVGHADGGPYFKDQKGAGAWFFILRHACLPESIMLDQSLAHMPLLIPAEHWEDNLIKGSRTGERDGIYCKKKGYI
jgi:hypothetical protein